MDTRSMNKLDPTFLKSHSQEIIDLADKIKELKSQEGDEALKTLAEIELITESLIKDTRILIKYAHKEQIQLS